jgi:phospholipase/carboxylesterase
VTLNGGAVMRAWYDLHDLRFSDVEDRQGIEDASVRLLELMEREQQRGIDSGNILLAGFSQGGALCLHTGLRFPHALAGLLGLSTYLPLPALLAEECRADPDTLAIRLDHGSDDPLVPYAFAQRSRQLIEAQGYRVAFNTYAMGHSLCPEQIESLIAWMAERLNAGGGGGT